MPDQPTNRWVHLAATALIVGVGLACGLCGIQWGLPSTARVELLGDDLDAIRQQIQGDTEARTSVVIAEPESRAVDLARAYRRYFLYSYHPDEMLTLMGLAKMHPSKLDFHPHLFQYGGLFVYPIGALLYVSGRLGLVTLTPDLPFYLQHPQAFGQLYVVGRLFVVAFCVATAVLVYRLGRRIGDPISALVGALLFLLSPGAIVFSHEMKPHAASAFFVLLMWHWLFRLLHESRRRHLWLATLACGAATAMVFTHEIFLLAVLSCVWFVRGARLGDSLLKTAWCCALLGAVYFACNPYVLVDFQAFLAEARHVKQWYEPGFRVAGAAGFIQHPLIGSLGLPTTLLAIWGFIVLTRTHKAWAWVALAITVLYCALLVNQLGTLASSPKMARLMFALFPLMAVAAAAGLAAVPQAWVRHTLACVALAWITWCTWPYLEGFRADSTGDNTRVRAGRWINENVPAGSSVLVPPSPAPYKLPPFAFARYRLVMDASQRPDYVVSVGYSWVEPSYALASELRRGKTETPLSFANQPVFICRRTAK